MESTVVRGPAGLQEARSRTARTSSLLIVAGLLLIPIAVSVALYWKVIAVDAGWLAVSDDAAMLARVRDNPTFAGLQELHGLHFVPAMRLTFLVMYSLFGVAWTPYGVVLVLTHGLLASSIGLFVYRFSRSWPAALAVALPVVTAWSLSSGVLTSFAYAPLYLLVSLMILAAVLVDHHLQQPSTIGAVLLALIAFWCIATILSGAIVYVLIAVFYVGLKIARSDRPSWLGRVFALERGDIPVIGLLAASLLVYAAGYATQLQAVGWKLPVEMAFCQEDVPLSNVDRFLYVFSYGYVGAINQGGFTFLPTFIGGWRYLAAGGSVVAIVAALGVALFGTSLSTTTRSAAVAIAGCLIVALLAAVLVTAGRSCLQFWHMRYSFYMTAFVSCAVGVLLGLVLNALPRRVEPVLAAAMLVGSVVVAYQNVQMVQASDWLVKRAPGFMLLLPDRPEPAAARFELPDDRSG